MNQCTHCTMRGNLKGCLETPCNQHESWMVLQLKAELASLREMIEALRTGDTCARQCEGQAYRFEARQQRRRADALAATISALQDVVTHDGETKADFVARVRAILGADPDERLHKENEALRADAERYRWLRSVATQKTAWDIYGDGGHWTMGFFSKDSRASVDAAIDAAMREGK